MFTKDQQQQRDLFESERNFRLLVEGVVDRLRRCRLRALHARSDRHGDQLEHRRPAHQGLPARRDPRPAFLPLLHRSRPRQRQAAPRPAHRREHGRYEEEGWRVRKDGTFFWASVVIDPIREDGELVGFAKITRDITERREAQLKLEQMQQQLGESQKLDALGQLTGGVAHDFNNLLMIISGSLHTLKKGVDDDPKLQRALSAIEAATKRGAALTSQLLTFARRQSVNPQPIDVTERIDAVRDVLDTGVGGAVTLQFDVARDVWPVMVDVAEFETALVNLVINARDAMPDGGTITVAAHNATLSDEANAGDYVAISRGGYRHRHRSRRPGARSSTPSSRPSRSARAPGWAFRRFTASRIRPAARSRWPANSARAPGHDPAAAEGCRACR